MEKELAALREEVVALRQEVASLRGSPLSAGNGVAAQSATNQHCFICAGADDDPDFDECAVCGRKGVPLPYGGSLSNIGAAAYRPPQQAINDPESPLARAVRLARGAVEPEDVPGILQRIALGKSSGRSDA